MKKGAEMEVSLQTVVRTVLFVCCWVTVPPAVGYETDTHARMTEASILRSQLMKGDILQRLGIRQTSNLGNTYFDRNTSLNDEVVHERYTFDGYTLEKLPEELRELDDQPILWMARGAVREDDLRPLVLVTPVGVKVFISTPADDPEGNITRVLNHFYDPYNKEPLNVEGVGLGKNAVDWATGLIDSFGFRGSSKVPNVLRRNHFTILDAREAMYRALTGLKGSGDEIVGANEGSRKTTEPRDLRNAYWATLFRSLGNVLHLVQDMAQPQHTRNDRHTPVDSEYRKVYETYINWRAKGDVPRFALDSNEIDNPRPLEFMSYPSVPAFARYADYFSTGRDALPSVQELLEGKGMADISNREFFSAGTNFGNNVYPSPPNDASQFQSLIRATILANGNAVEHTFLTRDITDHLAPNRPELVDAPLTAEGAFDSFLAMFDRPKRYYLTRGVYDRMADVLIPQGVAYGAGLINHFFRGRLELTIPEAAIYGILDHSIGHSLTSGGSARDESGQIFGFKKLRVNVRNTTDPIQEPGDPAPEPVQQDLLDGEIRAVVKYQLNHCYEPDLSGQMPQDEAVNWIPDFETFSGCSGVEYLTGDPGYNPGRVTEALAQQEFEKISVSAPVSVGEAGDIQIGQDDPVEIDFDFKDDPIPVNARDVYLQVVYRGKLGPEDDPSKVEEDAVVVATKDISEPTFLTIINGTNYFRLDGKYYTKEQIDNDPELSDRLDLVIEDEVIPGGREAILEPRELTEVKFGHDTTGWASVDNLPVGRFSRIAVLTDVGEMEWVAQYVWSPYKFIDPRESESSIHTPDATLSQYREENNQYEFELYDLRRGIYTHFEYAKSHWRVVLDNRGEFDGSALERDARFKALPDFEELSPRPITCDFLGVVASCEDS